MEEDLAALLEDDFDLDEFEVEEDVKVETTKPLNPTPAGVIKHFFSVARDYMKKDRSGLHLTDLTVECGRKLWFVKKEPKSLEEIEPEALLRMFVGSVLHGIPLTEKHETELEYEGVKTSVDEYDPRTKTLIEKKFVTFVPRNEKDLKKYYRHYVEQVTLEALFLARNGYEVENAFLLFVRVGKEGPLVNSFRVSFHLEKAEKLLQEKLAIAESVLCREEPPEVPESYSPEEFPCSYCEYRKRCYF